MTTPLLSIIIPTYNRENIISISIESVLSQSTKDFELLIIDDHSTDNTEDLISQFMKRDNRIKYYKNTNNKGVSGARNTGLTLSNGKYIAFLDSDDAWSSSHLRNLLEISKHTKKTLQIITAAKEERTLDKTLIKDQRLNLEHYNKTPLSKKNAYLFNGDLFHLSFNRRVVTLGAAIFCSKFLLENNLKFNENLSQNEDSFFIKEALFRKPNVAYFNQCSLTCFIHQSNTSQVNAASDYNKLEKTSIAKIKYLKLLTTHFELESRSEEEIHKKISSEYYWMLAYNCYLPQKMKKKYFRATFKSLRYSFRPFIILSSLKNTLKLFI